MYVLYVLCVVRQGAGGLQLQPWASFAIAIGVGNPGKFPIVYRRRPGPLSAGMFFCTVTVEPY